MAFPTRRLLLGVPLLLLALALVFLLSTFLTRQPGTAVEAKANRLQSLAARVESRQVPLTISGALLNQLMEEDVQAHAALLQRIHAIKGVEAATKAENVMRAPYRARLRELSDAGLTEVSQEVSVITVGDRLSFSSVSFDGALRPKDPVSLLFFDQGQADNVYRALTTCGATACDSPFKDQDGSIDGDGLPLCSAQTQWVLMASADGPLRWRRSTSGVENANSACSYGVRDHMRLFEELTDAEYGAWMVATPHRESWEGNGHVIKSWAAANQAVLEAWPVASNGSPVQTTISSWVRCYVHTDGLYQGVEFDGKTALIDVH